jgi:hypothetical protein
MGYHGKLFRTRLSALTPKKSTARISLADIPCAEVEGSLLVWEFRRRHLVLEAWDGRKKVK